jgi:Tol biopolymer transport system component
MTKTTKYVIGILLVGMMLSCQSWKSVLIISPTSTVDASLLPRGKVFVGSVEGEYLVYNLDTGDAGFLTLFPECRILPQGREAICQREDRLYIVDIDSKHEAVLPLIGVDAWKFTSNRQGVLLMIDKENGFVELHYYDLGRGSSRLLATIHKGEWALFPDLSGDGNHLVGLYQANASNALIDIDLQNNSAEEISLSIDVDKILELSPSPIRAVLGIGATEVKWEDVNRCYTTAFYTYDVETGVARKIAHVPSGEACYEFFNIVARNIWSPDGTKVALVAGQKLCILYVGDVHQSCVQIARGDEIIDVVSWSPDSRFLAYILTDTVSGTKDLYLVSDDGTVKYALVGKLTYSRIVDLFWSLP